MRLIHQSLLSRAIIRFDVRRIAKHLYILTGRLDPPSKITSYRKSLLAVGSSPFVTPPQCIAVKDFNAETLGRALRERGIAINGSVGAGLVRITDPGGIGIELTG